MTFTCGDCGYYQEKICPVAQQYGFAANHPQCQSFSTVAWKCEICGVPMGVTGLIYDHASRKLVCERCYYTLPPVSEELVDEYGQI